MRLCFFAMVFIGGGVILPFLPTGLSGWVTTKRISILEICVRVSSTGVAISGVPKKTIFINNYYGLVNFNTGIYIYTCNIPENQYNLLFSKRRYEEVV